MGYFVYLIGTIPVTISDFQGGLMAISVVEFGQGSEMLSFSGLNLAFRYYFDGVFSLVQSGRAAACACSGLQLLQCRGVYLFLFP